MIIITEGEGNYVVTDDLLIGLFVYAASLVVHFTLVYTDLLKENGLNELQSLSTYEFLVTMMITIERE